MEELLTENEWSQRVRNFSKDLEIEDVVFIHREQIDKLFRNKYGGKFRLEQMPYRENKPQQKGSRDEIHRIDTGQLQGEVFTVEIKLRTFEQIFYGDLLSEVQHVGYLNEPGWGINIGANILGYLKFWKGVIDDRSIICRASIIKEITLEYAEKEPFKSCSCVDNPPAKFCMKCGSKWAHTNNRGKIWHTRNLSINEKEITRRGGFDFSFKQTEFRGW